jgi:hypothetical protein
LTYTSLTNITSNKLNVLLYKSRGLGQAKPKPGHDFWLWPGLEFSEAKAISGQAKAPAFRPSRAQAALIGNVSEKRISNIHILGFCDHMKTLCVCLSILQLVYCTISINSDVTGHRPSKCPKIFESHRSHRVCPNWSKIWSQRGKFRKISHARKTVIMQ